MLCSMRQQNSKKALYIEGKVVPMVGNEAKLFAWKFKNGYLTPHN